VMISRQIFPVNPPGTEKAVRFIRIIDLGTIRRLSNVARGCGNVWNWALQSTGITLVDVPSGKKDAADKALMSELFMYALQHPAPAAVVVITSDQDFAVALHRLSQAGYTVCKTTWARPQVHQSALSVFSEFEFGRVRADIVRVGKHHGSVQPVCMG
jgi:hypothetical protein